MSSIHRKYVNFSWSHVKQECIPVGCVLAAAVCSWSGGGVSASDRGVSASDLGVSASDLGGVSASYLGGVYL